MPKKKTEESSQLSTPISIGLSSKLFAVMIQIAVLLVGGGIAWGIVSTQVKGVQAEIVSSQISTQMRIKQVTRKLDQIETKNDRQDEQIDDIHVKNAREGAILENIASQLRQIQEQTKLLPQLKADVEVLKRQKHGR